MAESDFQPDLMAEKVNYLQQREDERIADLQKRKDERDKENVVEESLEFFLKKFNETIADIDTKLLKAVEIDKTNLNAYFDVIATDIQDIQKYISKCTKFLSQYDLRVSQKHVASMQLKMQIKRDELKPKKKFAFKAKDKYVAQNKSNEAEIPLPVHSSESDLNVDLANCKFINHSNEQLIKHAEEINGKDVALVDLNNCTVKLFGSPSVIHVNRLKNCVIYCGPVAGSIFIRGCEHCNFTVACQQLRIHTTTETHFNLHVTSRAIIEDCSNIKVSQYNLEYPELKEHYEISGLDRAINNWDKIDDFNWLNRDIQSPNWSIVTDNYIIK